MVQFAHRNYFSIFKHEKASIKMIDYMIKENNLNKYLDIVDINQTDLIFIKEIIIGPLDSTEDANVRINAAKHFRA